jgi:hypothetical protein
MSTINFPQRYKPWRQTGVMIAGAACKGPAGSLIPAHNLFLNEHSIRTTPSLSKSLHERVSGVIGLS